MHYQNPPLGETQSARLSEAFDPHRNSLGFLRFVFAVLVLVDHSFDLGGFHHHLDPMWQWTLGQESLAGFAVGGFFVISGFLITRSYMTARSTGNFMWRRFLRILPGFWACLLVTAIVLAPVVWWHQHGSLWGFVGAPRGALGYVAHNFALTMHQYDIAGLLANTPYYQLSHSLAFDGSLWTLVYEFECYLGVAALGLMGILRRRRVVVLGLAVSLWVIQVVITLAASSAAKGDPVLDNPQLIRLTLFFSIGAVMWLYAERIVMSRTLAGFAAGTLVFSLRSHLYFAVGELAFAYLVMWLATELPATRFDARGDFSYGIYIYAFPVEQVLSAWEFYRVGLAGYLAVAMAATMALAVASWFLIERPFLSLKNLRLSRRRMAAVWLARIRWRRAGAPRPGVEAPRAGPPGRAPHRPEAVGTGPTGGTQA